MKQRKWLWALLACALGVALVCGWTILIDFQRADAAPLASPSDSEHERLVMVLNSTGVVLSGTDTSELSLWGYIKAVHVAYQSGITNTTDVTLTTCSPAATIMVLSDNFTDTWYSPSVQLTGATGAAVSGAYGRFPVDDCVTVIAGESTAGKNITATVYYGQ